MLLLPLLLFGTLRTGTSTTLDSFGAAMTNNTPSLYTDYALNSFTAAGYLVMSSKPSGFSDGSP